MRTVTHMTPLWKGNWLSDIQKLKGFQRWDVIGISTVGNLFNQGELISFESLRLTYQMHPSQHYKYIQLKHAWRAEGLDVQEIEESAPLEGRLLEDAIEEKSGVLGVQNP